MRDKNPIYAGQRTVPSQSVPSHGPLRLAVLGLLATALLAGCASHPVGPSVMAMPGSGKNFDQFRGDDSECRAYADLQSGGTSANEAANDSGVRSAAAGAAVGAIAGAAMGGHQGAGVGAGAGLLMGSMAGVGASEASAGGVQRRYDNAYVQCMYAKGERVPVPGQLSSQSRAPAYAAPRARPPVAAPAPYMIPPPPPGSPPPPPPGT